VRVFDDRVDGLSQRHLRCDVDELWHLGKGHDEAAPRALVTLSVVDGQRDRGVDGARGRPGQFVAVHRAGDVSDDQADLALRIVRQVLPERLNCGVLAGIWLGLHNGVNDLVWGEGRGVHLSFAGLGTLQVLLIAFRIMALEGAPVLQHGLGRDGGIINLAPLLRGHLALDDLEACAKVGQEEAVLLAVALAGACVPLVLMIGNVSGIVFLAVALVGACVQQIPDALSVRRCEDDSAPGLRELPAVAVAGLVARHPLCKKRRLVAAQVGDQLGDHEVADNWMIVVDQHIVPTSVFWQEWDELSEGVWVVVAQPVEAQACGGPLALAAADVSEVEEGDCCEDWGSLVGLAEECEDVSGVWVAGSGDALGCGVVVEVEQRVEGAAIGEGKVFGVCQVCQHVAQGHVGHRRYYSRFSES